MIVRICEWDGNFRVFDHRTDVLTVYLTGCHDRILRSNNAEYLDWDHFSLTLHIAYQSTFFMDIWKALHLQLG